MEPTPLVPASPIRVNGRRGVVTREIRVGEAVRYLVKFDDGLSLIVTRADIDPV